MNLDNVTVEMRPRSEWEAADLGVRMVRRDAAAIYRTWFAITLPLLALAISITVFTPYAALATVGYWWLEPVADGPILRIISRRLFGEGADVRSALRFAFRLAWINRIFLLPPYRFHFARSVAMPVTQLEGLSGSARRARAKVINLKVFNHGVGVTVAYEHLFLALYFGVGLLGYALIPEASRDTLGGDWMGFFFADSSRTGSAIGLLAVYAAQSALQPWFVGAGFGLYINCRTQLEAWDIEVAFRRIVQRRAGNAVSAVAAMFLAASLLLTTAPADAREDNTAAAPTDDPGFAGYWGDASVRSALESVFVNDDLNQYRETREWQRLDPEPEAADDAVGDGSFVKAVRDIGKWASLVLEFGLWLALAVLLVVLVATRAWWLPFLGFGAAPVPKRRRIRLAGGDLTAEELPDDIPAEALRLWRSGAKRQALSLLYRGSVFAAVIRHGVRLPVGATEGACVRAVSDQAGGQPADFFRRVVSAWVHCAYAGREPGDAVVEPLCAEWPSHFGALQ